MSLKVTKFDTKNVLNFSNFRGRTSAAAGGGEQALVQKRGQVSDGGLTKFSPEEEKNPGCDIGFCFHRNPSLPPSNQFLGIRQGF